MGSTKTSVTMLRTTRLLSSRALSRSYGNCVAPTFDGFMPMLIDNEFKKSEATDFVDIINPATQEKLSKVPLCTQEELKAATASCAKAFPGWKTTSDAHGDVFRGLEVVEHTCSMGNLQMGGHISGVSTNMDSYEIRQPIGVCAGITPFNFPVMCPMWMVPVAIASGNTFLLKPSEKDAGAAVILAKLAIEAGLPPGVLNIVHGTVDCVNFMCDHPEIKAVAFVGSNQAGEHIYTRASANGKRVQANMG